MGLLLRMFALLSSGVSVSRRSAICVASLAVGSLTGNLLADQPPKKIDIGNLPAEIVGEVVIPIPQEIFSSLDKLGHQNWKSHLMRKEASTDPNRSRTALVFGLVIAEGFIAVQAEDKDEVKRVGREVLMLAEKLSVGDAVKGHAGAIVDGANLGDWVSVRRELDRTRQTVINEMETNRDEALSDMVSLGGWLGGTRVLSGVLAEHYDPEASELIHQPDLVRRIQSRYLKLPQRSRSGSLFASVEKVLETLTKVMKTDGEGKVPNESVQQIYELTSDLAAQVFGK